jgi:hypothetical protein
MCVCVCGPTTHHKFIYFVLSKTTNASIVYSTATVLFLFAISTTLFLINSSILILLVSSTAFSLFPFYYTPSSFGNCCQKTVKSARMSVLRGCGILHQSRLRHPFLRPSALIVFVLQSEMVSSTQRLRCAL